VAHLAGSLDVPVWTLLPFANDWRWLRGRDDSAWYPSMRLVRQPAPRDWDAVLERVAAMLADDASRLAATRSGARTDFREAERPRSAARRC